MFTILPADESTAEKLAQQERLPMPLSAMVLTVEGQERGYALFRVKDDEVELLCLHYEGAEWGEWLVRAVLNAAANRGALTACCQNPSCDALLQALGFGKTETGYTQCIPDFFNRPCSGCGQ